VPLLGNNRSKTNVIVSVTTKRVDREIFCLMTSDELPISTFSSKFLFVCYLSPKLQINFFHCPFLYSFFIQQPFFNRLSYLSSLTHTELLFTFAFPSVFGIFILPIGNKFVWHVNVYLNIINERVFQIIGFRHKILCNVSISVCLCGHKIALITYWYLYRNISKTVISEPVISDSVPARARIVKPYRIQLVLRHGKQASAHVAWNFFGFSRTFSWPKFPRTFISPSVSVFIVSNLHKTTPSLRDTVMHNTWAEKSSCARA